MSDHTLTLLFLMLVCSIKTDVADGKVLQAVWMGISLFWAVMFLIAAFKETFL